MKKHYYRITPSGKIVKTQCRMSAHVSAGNLTEAKTKILQFAARALDEPPVLKTQEGAAQLAFWTMDLVSVQAGYGNRPDLCISGVESMNSVKPDTASFDYYLGMSREDAARA